MRGLYDFLSTSSGAIHGSKVGVRRKLVRIQDYSPIKLGRDGFSVPDVCEFFHPHHCYRRKAGTVRQEVMMRWISCYLKVGTAASKKFCPCLEYRVWQLAKESTQGEKPKGSALAVGISTESGGP